MFFIFIWLVILVFYVILSIIYQRRYVRKNRITIHEFYHTAVNMFLHSQCYFPLYNTATIIGFPSYNTATKNSPSIQFHVKFYALPLPFAVLWKVIVCPKISILIFCYFGIDSRNFCSRKTGGHSSNSIKGLLFRQTIVLAKWWEMPYFIQGSNGLKGMVILRNRQGMLKLSSPPIFKSIQFFILIFFYKQ